MDKTIEEKICITCSNKNCKKAINKQEQEGMQTIKCNNYIKDRDKITAIKKITYLKRNTVN